jgi:hypothetical protein
MNTLDPAQWRRSSKCESGACVEVRRIDDQVEVRNSTEPGLQLAVSTLAWQQFRQGVVAGEFDRD